MTSAAHVRPGRGWIVGAVLLSLPVAVGIGYALLGSLGYAGPGASGFDAERFGRVIGSPQLWSGLVWSLWIAFASTALSVLLAAALAATFRQGTRYARPARLLAALPLPVPHVVAAVSAVLILGQSGLVSRMAAAAGLVASPAEMPAWIYDPWGVGLIVALVWKETPFLALVAFSVLDTRGDRLEELGRTLGANRWQLLRRVTWPTLWRGMLPAVIAVFTFVFGTYEATALLAPSDPLAIPLATMELYTDPALGRRGDAFVLVLLTLLVAAFAVVLHQRAARRAEPSGG